MSCHHAVILSPLSQLRKPAGSRMTRKHASRHARGAHTHVDRSDVIATFRLHLNASSSTDLVMVSRVRTDCTRDEALAPSNTRTATERGHKTAPQRRRKIRQLRVDHGERVRVDDGARGAEAAQAGHGVEVPAAKRGSRRSSRPPLASFCLQGQRGTTHTSESFQPQRRCPMAADGSKQPVWLDCPPLWRGPGLHRRLCTLDAQLDRRPRHRRLLR